MATEKDDLKERITDEMMMVATQAWQNASVTQDRIRQTIAAVAPLIHSDLIEENERLRTLTSEMRKEHHRLIAAMDGDDPWDEGDLAKDAAEFLQRELQARAALPHP